MTINDGGYVGFFGRMSESGVIKNLTLEDAVITGNGVIGSIVGYNNGGTIMNCANTVTDGGTASVSSTGGLSIGGIVGCNVGGTVTDCTNASSVSGKTNVYLGSSSVGGVVGQNLGGAATNCTNSGEVSGDFYVGGVVGSNDDDKPGTQQGGTQSTVSSCTNTGTVSLSSADYVDYANVGGVAGNNINSNVINSTNTGNVSSDDGVTGVGSVVGDNDSNSTVQNCVNVGGTVNGIVPDSVCGSNSAGDGTVTNSASVDTTGEGGAAAQIVNGIAYTIEPSSIEIGKTATITFKTLPEGCQPSNAFDPTGGALRSGAITSYSPTDKVNITYNGDGTASVEALEEGDFEITFTVQYYPTDNSNQSAETAAYLSDPTEIIFSAIPVTVTQAAEEETPPTTDPEPTTPPETEPTPPPSSGGGSGGCSAGFGALALLALAPLALRRKK